MGGETINISTMAEKISKEIFKRFGWEVAGPMNENFTCIIDKHKNLTHPTDIVFTYDDLYTGMRHYILTDLKSYSKKTIATSQFKNTIFDLSKAVDCANSSKEWQDKHTSCSNTFSIHGLLFVYNHDNAFDMDFSSQLRTTKSDQLYLPSESKLYVIGPDRISYLLNILNDITTERGLGNLPFNKKIDFWYPDFVTKHPVSKEGVASIELLMGPWQILPYKKYDPAKDKIIEGIYLYYYGKGESPKEFELLIDFCFKSQFVQNDNIISIRMPNYGANALHYFEQAKDNTFLNFHSIPEIKKRLDQIEVVQIATVMKTFSTEQIGMEARQNG